MPRQKVEYIKARMEPALRTYARRLRADLSTFTLTPAMLRAIASQDFARFRFLVMKAMRKQAHAKKAAGRPA